MSKIICVTGFMAAGKNAVCSLLESSGFVSLDADKAIHEAINNSKDEIIKAFEKEAASLKVNLLNSDNTINRRALGQIVFSKPELLSKQESIVYPKLDIIAKDFIKKNSNTILNATVLFKTPSLMSLCSKIVFVKAPFIVRLYRAIKRDKNLSVSQILKRFKAQKNLLENYKATGIPVICINNATSKKSLQKKLAKLSANL